jgi:hypothetical protein
VVGVKLIEQVQEAIPHSSWLSWTAALTGLASVLTTWVPIVVGVMSGIWIGLQLWIFLFVTQPWKKGKPRA